MWKPASSLSLLLLPLAATATQEGTTLQHSQDDVHLVLGPSASRIEAWIVDEKHVVSLDLGFSFLDTEEQSTITVEYAVVRLPAEDLRPQEDEARYYCDENGCSFIHDTNLVLASGVGTKASSSFDGNGNNGNRAYLWCGTNNKDLKEGSDLTSQNQPRGGNLIHNDKLLLYNRIQVKGSTHTIIASQEPEAIDIPFNKKKPGYSSVLLLANCNGHGQSVLVDGKPILGTPPATRKNVPGADTTDPPQNNHQSTRRRKPAEQEATPWQAMAAPLVLLGILGAVYFVKEQEGREISEEDAYQFQTRNAGYKSLPMMDLNR